MAEFDVPSRRDSNERSHEQDRAHLRKLLLQGSTSMLLGPIDKAYIDGLRDRIRQHDPERCCMKSRRAA